MGGKNPYVEPAKLRLPTKTYTLTFLPMNVVVEVDPAKIPYGRDGLPGSVLDVALAHGVPIDHACGGVVACSTCHCVVKQGSSCLPEMTDAEGDMLEYAPGLTPASRLACQAVPDGSCDQVVVEIPNWNRNLAKEADH